MKENETIKITIPAVNEYPFEKVEKWAKGYYRKADKQVDKQRAQKIKDALPIEMASYAVKMTFGFWRLMGPACAPASAGRPAPGRPAKEAPLEIVLKCLRPHVEKSKWGQIKPKFTKQLTTSFNAICNSNYNPEMVKEVNDDVNKLLDGFTQLEIASVVPLGLPRNDGHCERPQEAKQSHNKTGTLHMDFVLHPETAESYDSPRILGIRSKIWGHFTGKPLDLSLYPTEAVPPPDWSSVRAGIPGRPIQMEMHLAISVQ